MLPSWILPFRTQQKPVIFAATLYSVSIWLDDYEFLCLLHTSVPHVSRTLVFSIDTDYKGYLSIKIKVHNYIMWKVFLASKEAVYWLISMVCWPSTALFLTL